MTARHRASHRPTLRAWLNAVRRNREAPETARLTAELNAARREIEQLQRDLDAAREENARLANAGAVTVPPMRDERTRYRARIETDDYVDTTADGWSPREQPDAPGPRLTTLREALNTPPDETPTETTVPLRAVPDHDRAHATPAA